MVELYLDKLYDLLAPDISDIEKRRNKLELQEDPESGMVTIKNARILPVNSLSEAKKIYSYGIE